MSKCKHCIYLYNDNSQKQTAMLITKRIKAEKVTYETEKGNCFEFDGTRKTVWYFLFIPVYTRRIKVNHIVPDKSTAPIPVKMAT